MKQCFWDVFATVEGKQPLVFKGKLMDGCWSEGCLVTAESKESTLAETGIKYGITMYLMEYKIIARKKN